MFQSIGSKFRELCQRACADQGGSVPRKILRSIMETITARNLVAVHALRTGRGGNDPQRSRGSDKAQRRDIDRDFHLHYWECADRSVELASVVHHNEFSIPVVMPMQDVWEFSTVHNSVCKVIEEQILWGQTVCRVWLPNQDAVVRDAALRLAAAECRRTAGDRDRTRCLCGRRSQGGRGARGFYQRH